MITLSFFQNDCSTSRGEGYALAGLGANHDRFNDRRIDFGVRLPFYEEVGTGSAAFLIFSDYETYGFLPKTLFMASLSGALNVMSVFTKDQ
jgi:hypothetical protein